MVFECGPKAPESLHGTHFPRRAWRAGLLHFPIFLQLSGLRYLFSGALRAPDCFISLYSASGDKAFFYFSEPKGLPFKNILESNLFFQVELLFASLPGPILS